MTNVKSSFLFESGVELEEESIEKFCREASNGKPFEMKLNRNRHAAIVTFEATVDAERLSTKCANSKAQFPHRTFIKQLSRPINTICVSNLPPKKLDRTCEEDKEFFLLYFESARMCPHGGNVKSVKFHPCGHKVIVEFDDNNVAENLFISQKCLYEGKEMRIKLLSNASEAVSCEECSSIDAADTFPNNRPLPPRPGDATNSKDLSAQHPSYRFPQRPSSDVHDNCMDSQDGRSNQSPDDSDDSNIEWWNTEDTKSNQMFRTQSERPMKSHATCGVKVLKSSSSGEHYAMIKLTSGDKYKLLKSMLSKGYGVFLLDDVARDLQFSYDDSQRAVKISSRNGDYDEALKGAALSLEKLSREEFQIKKINLRKSPDMEDWATTILREARLPVALLYDDTDAPCLASFGPLHSAFALVENSLLTGKLSYQSLGLSRTHFLRDWYGFTNRFESSGLVNIFDEAEHIKVYGLPRHVIKVIGEIEDHFRGRR